MKVFYIIIGTMLFAGSILAKEIKIGSKEQAKDWEVGDEVEGLGKVIAKKIQGDTVTVTFENENTTSFIYKEKIQK